MKNFFFSIGILFAAASTAFASGHVVTITGTNAHCTPSPMMYSDGTATATVTGGVGPFSYSWVGPPGYVASVPSILNLYPWQYVVTVTDSSDMSTATDSITISGPPAINISLASSYSICSGGSVNLTPTVTGGTPAYTFNWSPAASLSSPVTYSPSASPSTSTSYTFTVTDGNGCVGAGSTTVYVSPPITVTATTTSTSSCFSVDGTGTITATGGSSPYVYTWAPLSGSGSPFISGLAAGTYAVSVMDANGCTGTTSATVHQMDIISDFTAVPDSANAYTVMAFNTSSAGSPLHYYWTFGDGTSDSTSVSPVHTYASAGTYTVCLNSVASLAGGCSASSCHDVTITGVLSSCLALFSIADDTSTTAPNAYTVYNLSYGATLSYLWDFGDGSTSTLRDPVHVYSTSTGPYQICLTVDNGSGCTQTYCDSIFSVDSISRTSNPISFTVVEGPSSPGTVTGINEQQENVSATVYPNPFNDYATIEIQSAKANAVYSFELTDVLGKTVRRIKTNEKVFTVSRNGLEDGMYFYKVYNAEHVIGMGKVVIR